MFGFWHSLNGVFCRTMDLRGVLQKRGFKKGLYAEKQILKKF